MKKIIRMTESDLVRLVKKIVKEQRTTNRDEFGNLEFEFSDKLVMLRGANQSRVEKILSKLPETIVFLAIVDCEFADFSNVDICSFPNLEYVNLKDTENNFEENIDCDFNAMNDGLYIFRR